MSQNQQIAKALAAATDTAALEIGVDILDRVPVMFKEQFPEGVGLFCGDQTTLLIVQAEGCALQRLSRGGGGLEHLHAVGFGRDVEFCIDLFCAVIGNVFAPQGDGGGVGIFDT